MKKITINGALFSLVLFCASGSSAQVVISGAGYSENFNAIGTAALPAGWSVRTGASASSLGSIAPFSTASVSWGDTAGAFKNFAAASGLSSSATLQNQTNATNRALGVRATGSFGDPGAAFVFHFSSLGVRLDSFEIDLMLLSVQPRSTVWTIDYGIGAAPTTFSTLDTWSTPAEFGTTPITILSDLSHLSNQAEVWVRIVALTGSSGSGARDSMAIDNLSISATAIPEPATSTALCGVAVMVLAAAFRFTRRARTQIEGGPCPPAADFTSPAA